MRSGLMVIAVAGLLAVTHTTWGHAQSVKDDRAQSQQIPVFDHHSGSFIMVDRVVKSDEEWRRQLTAEQYEITRKKGTERAYSGSLLHIKERGVFQCVACGTDLYDSETKYDSRTGWPSFWTPVAEQNIRLVDDSSFFMRRTEVVCARCGAHLGHVFDDGPAPTGKRHCINSAALSFVKTDDTH